MRILCAPDSFKETISASDVAAAMADGFRDADPAIDVDLCPIADGGEGSVDVMLAALKGERISCQVADPLGRPVQADFGIIREAGIGIVELAQASGLHLLRPGERDPTQTTTFGTGQLMRAAAEQGCRELLLFIGGSATVDGGVGIAQALGACFFDVDGRLMPQLLCGGDLIRIARVEPPEFPEPPDFDPAIRIACDVTNPLLGPRGAARTYGPQKGASPQQIDQLERGLQHLAEVIGGDAAAPGAGAAGGVGFGLSAIFGAAMERGVKLVFDAVRFAERCAHADFVVTGEGCLDAQSLDGKACIEVAAVAARHHIPTIAIVGATGDGFEQCIGGVENDSISRVISLTDEFGSQRARSAPAELIRSVCVRMAQEL